MVSKESDTVGEQMKISTINMKKNLRSNVKFLQGFLRTAKPEVKDKIHTLVDLYQSRKISNLTTAENMIMKLKAADPKVRDANPNSFKNVFQKCDKLVSKCENLEPLNVRMGQAKKVRQERIVQENKRVGAVSRLQQAYRRRLKSKKTYLVNVLLFSNEEQFKKQKPYKGFYL